MKLKSLLLLLLNISIVLSASAQFGPKTNNLWSVSNILTQFKYDGKPNQAFTNTVVLKPANTNNPALQIWFGDNTNEYIWITATNNAIYITGSNAVYSPTKLLIIQYTNGVPMIWNDNQANGNGFTPLLGNITCPWQIYGTNAYLKGATYGFMSPTNITVMAINVSGNSDSQSTFINPNVTAPGMYEVQCTAVCTQVCSGATLQLGVIASNSFGFMTNWMFQDYMPLTALTNRSGSILTSNANFSLASEFLVKNWSSGTALGYINWYIRQVQ